MGNEEGFQGGGVMRIGSGVRGGWWESVMIYEMEMGIECSYIYHIFVR